MDRHEKEKGLDTLMDFIGHARTEIAGKEKGRRYEDC